MSQNHLPRLHQQRQSTNPTPRRLTDWNATDLVLQAIEEGRPASELLDEALAEDRAAALAAARSTRWENAGNLLLIGLGLVVTWCAVTGAIHILTGMGVGA